MGTALLDRQQVTPDRSLEQRMDALANANAIRSHRAALKRDLKAGRRSLVDALLDPEPELETMKLIALLLATPKVGRVKANKIIVKCKVSPSKTVGGLSPRQREELAGLLAPWGRG